MREEHALVKKMRPVAVRLIVESDGKMTNDKWLNDFADAQSFSESDDETTSAKLF